MPPRRTLTRTNPDFQGRQGAAPRTDVDGRDHTRVVLHNTETGGVVVMRRSALRSLGDGWTEVREVGEDTERAARAAVLADLGGTVGPADQAVADPSPDAAAAKTETKEA
jgi:hypothetical protein